MWDAVSGERLSLLHSVNEKPLKSASFSPDGSRILTVSNAGAKLWGSREGQPLLQTLKERNNEPLLSIEDYVLEFATFSPDGRQILAGTKTSILVFDAANGWRLFIKKTGPGAKAIFSADGTRILSWKRNDNYVVVRDASNGDLLARMTGWAPYLTVGIKFPDSVNSASFSYDGSRVGTAANGGTAKIWSSTGSLVYTLRHHETEDWLKDNVGSIAFSTDGTKVFTTGRDNTAKVWLLPQPSKLYLVSCTML